MTICFSDATLDRIKRNHRYSNDDESNATSDESDEIENHGNDSDDDLTGTSVRTS